MAKRARYDSEYNIKHMNEHIVRRSLQGQWINWKSNNENV